MRYFAKLSYKGTQYHGWQVQPNDPSVQETLDKGLSIILKTKIEITGCGRTDSGVHAKDYVAHFDFDGDFPDDFLKRINKHLPDDILITSVTAMTPEAHARFDATHRAYEYHIIFKKTPFEIDTAYQFPFAKDIDFEKLQAAASLLLSYKSFFPFCKTNTQVHTMDCTLFRSEWEIKKEEGRMVFHIAANRFLRGMVRLIVGTCLNAATNKISIEEIKKAMDQQTRLAKSLSVPAHGLYLVDIRYPYEF